MADITQAAPLNNMSMAFGSGPPPTCAPGIMAAINGGCAQVGGGTGAFAREQGPDITMPPISVVPVPATEPAYIPGQTSETLNHPRMDDRSIRSSIPTTDPDMIGGVDVTNIPESIGTGRMGRA
jgi:hypothetical protein